MTTRMDEVLDFAEQDVDADLLNKCPSIPCREREDLLAEKRVIARLRKAYERSRQNHMWDDVSY